jgi:hypothetical protein
MDILWIAVGVGLFIGSILSVLFGIYNRAGTEPYIRNIFGMSSADLIFDGIVCILAFGCLFLAVVSIVIRDNIYPSQFPLKFTLETLLMSVIPASIFLVMANFRGYKIDSKVGMEFSVLLLKFAILHLLLQFSGFYSDTFPPTILKGGRR